MNSGLSPSIGPRASAGSASTTSILPCCLPTFFLLRKPAQRAVQCRAQRQSVRDPPPSDRSPVALPPAQAPGHSAPSIRDDADAIVIQRLYDFQDK